MGCTRADAVASDGNRAWTKGCERRWKEEPKRGGRGCWGLQQERERLGGNFFRYIYDAAME
jgi:hypothetical protein